MRFRSIDAAFALALSYESSRSVKGPVVRTRLGFAASGGGIGDPARVAFGSVVVKEPPLMEVYGDTAGEAAPFPTCKDPTRGGVLGIGGKASGGSFNVAYGRCSSNILMIAAK